MWSFQLSSKCKPPAEWEWTGISPPAAEKLGGASSWFQTQDRNTGSFPPDFGYEAESCLLSPVLSACPAAVTSTASQMGKEGRHYLHPQAKEETGPRTVRGALRVISHWLQCKASVNDWHFKMHLQ